MVTPMNTALRELRRRCRTKLKQDIAEEAGVSPGFISAVLAGRKRPGPKLLAYLKLEAYEAYRYARGRASFSGG